MKDEIITIVMFLLLIALFVFTAYTVNTGVSKVSKALKKAEDSVYDTKDNTEQFEKAKDIWQKEKKALFYICGHSIIMDIDENIELGCQYIKEGDKKRAIHSFKKAQILLKDLSEREKISLDNIF